MASPLKRREAATSSAKRARGEAPIVFFFRPEGANGWLSNWSAHGVRHDGIAFKTVEHFFMYHKALASDDFESARRIIAAPGPKEAKALGRSVRGFDEKKWSAEREAIMLTGLALKIEQHALLKRAVLQTCGHVLAEASPYDALWGIGCASDDARARNPAAWPGKNLLGRLWMRLRESTVSDDAVKMQPASLSASTSQPFR